MTMEYHNIRMVSYSEYKAYLASDTWKKKRSEALQYYANKCAVCGSTSRLQVHHTPTAYKYLGRESVTALRILCKNCHKKGRYSAWEIDRDRESLFWLEGIEGLVLLPFFLIAWIFRKIFMKRPPSAEKQIR